MPTSDKDLEALRTRADKLRAQVAAEETKRLTREAEVVNDIAAAQLNAEIARLELQLESAKDGNKVAAVKEGAAAPLEAAKAEMEAAVAAADAAHSNGGN